VEGTWGLEEGGNKERSKTEGIGDGILRARGKERDHGGTLFGGKRGPGKG